VYSQPDMMESVVENVTDMVEGITENVTDTVESVVTNITDTLGMALGGGSDKNNTHNATENATTSHGSWRDDTWQSYQDDNWYEEENGWQNSQDGTWQNNGQNNGNQWQNNWQNNWWNNFDSNAPVPAPIPSPPPKDNPPFTTTPQVSPTERPLFIAPVVSHPPNHEPVTSPPTLAAAATTTIATATPYSQAIQDDKLPPGAIVALVLFGVVCVVVRYGKGALQWCREEFGDSLFAVIPTTHSFLLILILLFSSLLTITSSGENDGEPVAARRRFVRDASTSQLGDGTALSTCCSSAESLPENLTLIRSMTRQERRDYVTHFLYTQVSFDLAHLLGLFSDRGGRSNDVKRPGHMYGLLKNVEERDSENNDDDGAGTGRFVIAINFSVGNQECDICLQKLCKGEDICSWRNARCSSQFHLACALEWLLSAPECPGCRRRYFTNPAASAMSFVGRGSLTALIGSTTKENERALGSVLDHPKLASVQEIV
jgi:hypothetical protein